ncbi:MAG: YiiX/YebB-like N1pC/P60 family cysteine hydrolase [Candidatus Nitrotoga sp.]
MFRLLGHWLANYLTRPIGTTAMVNTCDLATLQETLQPGDILLIDGNTRISSAIKFLTNSTWSHAAFYVGPHALLPAHNGQMAELIESDLIEGVRAIPLANYAMLQTRICRPVGLTAEDKKKVIDYVIEHLGDSYDLRNVIDLVRYLLPNPPVFSRWRRRMLALGSGDPTRAICSTLIAQAFQIVRYPILPIVTKELLTNPKGKNYYREYMHIRHHSLFTPRDFDISPYFEIIKPTLNSSFKYREIVWADQSASQPYLT